MFGCKHRDGRAATAPVLRAGIGTSKGELLRLAEESSGTMLWHGRVFPRSGEGDRDTPEALPACDGVLPHLHEDSEERFPAAVACEALKDQDPDGDEGLEDRGRNIGVQLGTSCGEKNRGEAAEA